MHIILGQISFIIMLQFASCSEFIREGLDIVDITSVIITGNPSRISFKDNRIDWIPSNYFPVSLPTTELDLSENKISFLESYSLSMLNNLEVINLERNRLGKIKMHMFYNLTNLKHLSIGYNHVSAIEDNSLSMFINLKYLDMERNDLTVIKTLMFINLANLKYLSLKHNAISKLESKCFASLVQLERLELKYNYLTVLPSDIFNLDAHPSRLDLYMKENPLQCSSQMCWIKLNEYDNQINPNGWIHIHGQSETICVEPTFPSLSHQWSDLTERDLQCHLYTTSNGKLMFSSN